MCKTRFASPDVVALGMMGWEGLGQVPRNPWKPGPPWPLQVLGPKPALKEGNPEEDLTADRTNAQAAALYKVGTLGLPWAGAGRADGRGGSPGEVGLGSRVVYPGFERGEVGKWIDVRPS